MLARILRFSCWPRPLLGCGQSVIQTVIALDDLINLRVGPGQRLFVLSHELGRSPVAPCLQSVLINDEEEEAAEQAQGKQVRPEETVPDTFIKQQDAAFIEALTIVLVSGVDVFQYEIDETIAGRGGSFSRSRVVSVLPGLSAR